MFAELPCPGANSGARRGGPRLPLRIFSPPLHVPPSSAARGCPRPPAPRPSPEVPPAPPSLTYGGVVGEGALVLVDPVPGPGHADRGHVGHQQLSDVSCSHLPVAAAARHAEQGAPALHGRGAHPSGAERSAGSARGGGGGLRGLRGRREPTREGWGERAAGLERARGAWAYWRAGRRDAAIFNPMANRRPSCSVRRGAGEGQQQRAGRGSWRGALRPGPARRRGRRARPRAAGSEVESVLPWGTTSVFSTVNR